MVIKLKKPSVMWSLNHISLFVIAFFLSILSLEAQQKNKKLALSGIALPSRTPETGWNLQGGALGVYKTDHKDSTLRASNSYLFATYSEFQQFRVSIGGDIFMPHENYYIYSWIYYSYVPDQFYKLRSDNKADNFEFITYRMWYANIDFLRKIKANTFFGLSYHGEEIINNTYKENGIFNNDQGVLAPNNYVANGLGLKLKFDSRDNLITSSKGSMIEVLFRPYFKGALSQYNFSTAVIDARRFVNFDTTHYKILAIQAYLNYTEGNVPFRMLPGVLTRAFHQNQLKNNLNFHLRSEFRFQVYNWFGTSIFTGIAAISRGFDTINLTQPYFNFGGGFRFRLSKTYNINLRTDIGYARSASNFYLSFIDAF